ncbi:MAG: PRC-barrel domain containing protein [Rhodobacteraceae bacterium]|nr:MAG: PRC-barrel domain containing protein [Paracoccaceae bacterium]
MCRFFIPALNYFGTSEHVAGLWSEPHEARHKQEFTMKKFMLTTALVAVTSMGAIAQTTNGAMQTETAAMSADTVPAFLVSSFTGKDLYTLDTEATRDLTQTRQGTNQTMADQERMRWESSDVFSGSRDAWNNVGGIDDIVMTKDGEVRGVLIDVGGFLGFGARTVMVDIDDLYFVADDSEASDLDDFFVVATMSREQLEALPEWDEDQLSMGFESTRNFDSAGMGTATEAPMQDGTAEHAEARTEVPAGYQVMPETERTADRLMGADVYGREGDNIATVDDLVIGADGDITHTVMDVGGFLGIGNHTIALEIDDVDILWNDEDGNVRVQVTMTQEEMESLPEYEG